MARTLLILVPLLTLAAGCGDDGPPGEEHDGGSRADAASDGAVARDGGAPLDGAAGDGGPPDAGVPGDATMHEHDAALPDAGAAEDGGLPPDDGGLPPDDAAVDPDAGVTPVDAGVAGPARIVCGTRECDAETHGCLASCLYATGERMPACVAMDAQGRWPADDCPTGMEMFPRFWLTCDGAEDCAAGEVCHMLYGSIGQYAYCASCEPPCDLRSFHELCRSDADCSAEAPRCLPQRDLPGYSTCEAP